VVVFVGVIVGVAVFVGVSVDVTVGVGVGQLIKDVTFNLITPLDGLV
jgi:hypothetical protein